MLKTISFPVPPPSMDDLYQRFEQAVTPRTKLILLCHITNRTGQIFPVRRICQMAHARNIPVIVDGAHAFSHFPFKISDLDCDYYGISLHKWTYAPIGTGFLYVRKIRIASTWRMMASRPQAGQRHSQVRGDRHASGGQSQRHLRGAAVQREPGDRPQSRAAALPARPLGQAAGAAPEVPHPAQPRSGAVLRHRLSGVRARRGWRKDAGSAVEQVQHHYHVHAPRGLQRIAHHAEYLQHGSRCGYVQRGGGEGTGFLKLGGARMRPGRGGCQPAPQSYALVRIRWTRSAFSLHFVLHAREHADVDAVRSA